MSTLLIVVLVCGPSFSAGFFAAIHLQPWRRAFQVERRDYLAIREKLWEAQAQLRTHGIETPLAEIIGE